MSQEVVYQPIGQFRCENHRPYGAPRQGVLAKEVTGYIQLHSPITRDCLQDLEGFDRLWLIYDFHKNSTWKPKVRPPRGSATKKSVFATRSPYRPNSIGMTCVKLEKIEGLKVFVQDHDLLDGTPILDIKPYLTYADSFDDAKLGWIDTQNSYEVKYTKAAKEKLTWLNDRVAMDIFGIVELQLEYEPTCRKAKRVKKFGDHFVFSLETWRLAFRVEDNEVIIFDLWSGYSTEEIGRPDDPYMDKPLHQEFLSL